MSKNARLNPALKLSAFGNTVTGLDISEVAIAQLPQEIKGVVSILLG